MGNRSHAIVAASFLIVFSIAAIVIYYWLANQKNEPLAYKIVTSQSVSGLQAQSEITFKGLVVGHVTQVGFDPDDRSQVVVQLQLEPHTYVTHATYAVVTRRSLTGGSVLELKLGDGSDQALATSQKNPATIPLQKSLLGKLEDSASEDMRDLHDVLTGIKKILDQDNRQHVANTLQQLDTVTTKLATIETRLMPTLQKIPPLLDETRHSMADAGQLLEDARAPVKRAAKLEAKLQNLAGSVQQLSDKLNRRSVPHADQLMRHLDRTSRQLDELLHELKAQPQSVLFGAPPPPPGPGEPGFDAHPQQSQGQ